MFTFLETEISSIYIGLYGLPHEAKIQITNVYPNGKSI
tara:strand:- start:141 stop:254 length:114 start_codon:yes stop_codon:yes gene_type:complete